MSIDKLLELLKTIKDIIKWYKKPKDLPTEYAKMWDIAKEIAIRETQIEAISSIGTNKDQDLLKYFRKRVNNHMKIMLRLYNHKKGGIR